MSAITGKTIGIVGMGYVGLPTALSFADHGAHIVGYDISEERLVDIKSRRVDLLPRDHKRLTTHLQRGVLRLTTEPHALFDAEAVVICVPTPIDAHQAPDLRALRGACAAVVENVRPGQTIVLTSTTYVGCTRELLVKPLTDAGLTVGTDVFIAFAPERIDPGVDGHAPDHTPRVMGGVTEACSERAARLLTHTASSIHVVSCPEAAEMTKLLENTYRAVNIALANEFADAANELGVDVIEVINAAATKPYGFAPFYPGPGVGGHCIPCDSHYLLWQLRERRFDAAVTRTAMTAISIRPRDVVDQARNLLAEVGSPVRGARILVVGVAYKPGVADVRESPALEIIEGLIGHGAEVSFTDPLVPSLRTSHGQLFNTVHPGDGPWDLVLVHTWHDGLADFDWLAVHPNVLDATYRLGREA